MNNILHPTENSVDNTQQETRHGHIDTDSSYYIVDRSRKVPRKPNLDQLDEIRN